MPEAHIDTHIIDKTEKLIANHTPSVRHDFNTGQFFPTINGVDYSPSSFSEDRAFEIAKQIAADAKSKAK